MNGFILENLVADTNGVSASASATTTLSKEFSITNEDSRNLLVNTVFSAVGETTGITLALQHHNGNAWDNVKSATAVTTVASVETITFPTKAGATAGDYVVVYDTAGLAWAVALDITGADAAPTGAIWAAIPAGRKTQADISADTTAAQVAARCELAFDGLTGFSAVITSDDSAADGTMTMTTVIAGVNTTNTVVKNADDSGAGSITAAQTTPGSFTASYEIENNIYDGTDTAMYPRARVVLITQAGDTATCSAVHVTRRL